MDKRIILLAALVAVFCAISGNLAVLFLLWSGMCILQLTNLRLVLIGTPLVLCHLVLVLENPEGCHQCVWNIHER